MAHDVDRIACYKQIVCDISYMTACSRPEDGLMPTGRKTSAHTPTIACTCVFMEAKSICDRFIDW